jgi:hypothetical protein
MPESGSFPRRIAAARGFRNEQNFIHAFYFHYGGLDLAPAATK